MMDFILTKSWYIPKLYSRIRFNIGIRCAEACLALGYSDPTLGYQSFLYSNNQTELRNIFMFLVTLMQEDRVDKDAQRIEDDCSGKKTLLRLLHVRKGQKSCVQFQPNMTTGALVINV